MEAIRKEKVKRIGSKITVELPDEFKAEEVDVIILPSKGDSLSIEKPIDVVEWRKDLIKGISKNTTYPSLLEKGKGVEVVKERFLEIPFKNFHNSMLT